MHDAGASLASHRDVTKAVRLGRAVQRVNVDVPVDLFRELDQEARRLGVRARRGQLVKRVGSPHWTISATGC
jgi:hypothetical protein